MGFRGYWQAKQALASVVAEAKTGRSLVRPWKVTFDWSREESCKMSGGSGGESSASRNAVYCGVLLTSAEDII